MEPSCELLANINSWSDAQAAVAMGADGVGLYRTEYLYLTHPDVPDEDRAAGKTIARSSRPARNHVVTIRTLDIGGDKTVPYLGHTHQEANPFLGWRSIRLSFEHPEFFHDADSGRRCEAATSRSAARRSSIDVSDGHDGRRNAPCEQPGSRRTKLATGGRRLRGTVPIGMMLEVPAAAISIDSMLDAVDFVSIGSNDLVQYLMAADRDNPKVNHLCQPLSSAGAARA